MKKVSREEILDYVTYAERRSEIQGRVLAAKAMRRIHVGEHLTFLFENAETIRYQIQEMMRVERIVKESDIQHEIDTYNAVLGGDGELGCTLLIEIDEPSERDRLLRVWVDLPKHLYVKLEDGATVYAKYDGRQVGEGRLSAVQYLKFATGSAIPVAIGSDLPEVTVGVTLSPGQRQALREDLGA
jgi:hypothetical protein